MRILAFTDVYFPRVNGVSVSIQTSLRALRHAGHGIVLVAPEYPNATPHRSPSEAQEEDMIIRVPSCPIPGDHEDRGMHVSKIQPALLAKFDKGLGKFDVVLIYSFGTAHFGGIRVAKLLRIPVVVVWHTHFEEYLYHYVNIAPAAVTKWVTRQGTIVQCGAADVIVTPSNEMRKILRDQYCISRDVRVVPTGIDTDHFDHRRGDGVAFRQKYGIQIGRRVLLYVGRLAFEKNVGFLLRMLKKATQVDPRLVLVMAGSGPAEHHLKQDAIRLGLQDNVFFVGWLDHETELLSCYRAADVFVFASRTETQGLALLEAMAMGVPVVSTACLGTVETLDPSYSVIVEEDEEKFALETLSLMHDADRRQSLSKAGIDYVKETWAVASITEQFLRVCTELLSANTDELRFPSSQRTAWEHLLWYVWEMILIYIFIGWMGFLEEVQQSVGATINCCLNMLRLATSKAVRKL
jgi:1,2-diacylglycerol 3-alpha-glucosyltransferase